MAVAASASSCALVGGALIVDAATTDPPRLPEGRLEDSVDGLRDTAGFVAAAWEHGTRTGDTRPLRSVSFETCAGCRVVAWSSVGGPEDVQVTIGDVRLVDHVGIAHGTSTTDDPRLRATVGSAGTSSDPVDVTFWFAWADGVGWTVTELAVDEPGRRV